MARQRGPPATDAFPDRSDAGSPLDESDVDAYLHRIGLEPDTVDEPDLEALTRIQHAHVTTVPFENLAIVGDPALSAALLLFGGPVIVLAYQVGFAGYYGQTPGKFLRGIVVVNKDGSDVGWFGAVVRNVLGSSTPSPCCTSSVSSPRI